MLEEQQPFLLIGSPPCTPYFQIQAINKARRDPKDVERELIAGRVHIDFCCALYRRQIARGANFLHEHPPGASSRKEPRIQAILQHKGVRRVRGGPVSVWSGQRRRKLTPQSYWFHVELRLPLGHAQPEVLWAGRLLHTECWWKTSAMLGTWDVQRVVRPSTATRCARPFWRGHVRSSK